MTAEPTLQGVTPHAVSTPLAVVTTPLADVTPPTNPTAELEILMPLGEVVTLASGEPITIKPYTFGQLLKALKYLTVLIDVMDGTELDILRALASHGEEVIGLIMLATGKERDFFENLDSAEGIDLALATYRVNSDFFARKLMPKLNQFQASTTSPDPESKEPKTPLLETDGSQ